MAERRSSPRTVELLEVPTGEALRTIFRSLTDALAGAGPVLAPVAHGDMSAIRTLTASLAIGGQIGEDEDDANDPTAIIVATSGSTGPPKGTLLSRSALAASAEATQRRLGAPGHWLLTLPAHHIAGLQVLLRSLAAGTRPHILDTALPFTPQRFAEATAALPDGPRYTSLVPTQLHRALADTAGTAALCSYSAVLVGGAATPAPLLQRAREAGASVVSTYGMSETCGGCVYDGVPLDGVRVSFDDERVLLGGPVVGRGYRNLPHHPAFADPGVFRTDDLGELLDGRLHIIGRTDDVIISGGLKVAPGKLEDAISLLPSVAEAVVIGLPDPEWGQIVAALIVAADPQHPPELAEVGEACRRAGIVGAIRPKVVHIVSELPLRGPGKPDRQAAAVLAGAAVARTPVAPS